MVRILKRLVSDLVRRTVADSYPKLLLRRTESVAEKLLSSWLAFTLHGYVVVRKSERVGSVRQAVIYPLPFPPGARWPADVPPVQGSESAAGEGAY